VQDLRDMSMIHLLYEEMQKAGTRKSRSEMTRLTREEKQEQGTHFMAERGMRFDELWARFHVSLSDSNPSDLFPISLFEGDAINAHLSYSTDDRTREGYMLALELELELVLTIAWAHTKLDAMMIARGR
jgi:hypothetical protein